MSRKKRHWSHLHNAAQIDRVLDLLRERSDNWDDAWLSARDSLAYDVRAEAWNQARASATDPVWFKICNAAWNVVWGEDAALEKKNWDDDKTTESAAYDSALYAFLALIAYDDAAEYLNMSSTELKIWAALSQSPSAILMLPVTVAAEKLISRRKVA